MSGAQPAQAQTAPQAPSFVHEVIPLLTRYGCNQGACHGKTAGQNGFRLSLRGYAPELDQASLTKEHFSRRIDTAVPETSLLLRKAIGEVPHEGGRLFSKGSHAYQVLLSWIKGGMPGPSKDDAKLQGLTLSPGTNKIPLKGTMQFTVTAEFSNGKKTDVTWLTRFATVDPLQALVDAMGKLEALRPGETALQAFFQDQVAVASITTPFQSARNPKDYPLVNNFIDGAVFNKLASLGIPVSGVCSDATFLRRLFLDTLGSLPKPEEVKEFLADQRADKRKQWIEKVLARPEFADFWALQLADLFQNRKERDHDVRGVKGVRSFHAWLREQVEKNRPWDQLCKDILTASGDTTENPAVGYFIVTVGEQREAHKSEVVASMAQSFLGTRIGCAQCHNHPLEKFTQDDYYRFSAFFSRLRLERKDPKDGVTMLFTSLKPEEQKRPLGVTQPRTGQFMEPRPLDRSSLAANKDADPRLALADWMIQPANDAFHGAFLNRLWKHFLGTGLVEPVDDLRSSNPPSNQELWKALKVEFISKKSDWRHMIRLILNSRVYQLESATVAGNENDTRFYSHYYPKRLAAEVLLDAVSEATGVVENFPGYPEGLRAIQVPDPDVRSYFMSVFGRSARVTACSCERSGEVSLSQLLHLQNGEWVVRKLGHAQGRIKELVQAKSSPEEKIQTLFLAAVSRLPSPGERVRLAELQAAPVNEEFLTDLLWALLNTVEFSFNH
ncbi:MAG: DUF1549 domain-containing protein [Gemmataceae bacterium]|nr:DUF1549 domain-containing protein [Gemmataceae bacterium]